MSAFPFMGHESTPMNKNFLDSRRVAQIFPTFESQSEMRNEAKRNKTRAAQFRC
jgi:hypothetical protein